MGPVLLILEVYDDGDLAFEEKVLKIVSNAIDPGSTSTAAADAALALDTFLTEWTTETGRDPEGFFWALWDLFHSFARQIPHDSVQQDKLAAIVKVLTDLPSKELVLRQWGSYRGWIDLPIFGAALRETWLCFDMYPELKDKQHFVNLQGWAARLFGLGLVPLERFAIWELVEALEGEMVPVRGSPDLVSGDPTLIKDLPFKLEAAAEWVIHAGGAMHGQDREVSGTHGGSLWVLPKKEANKLRRKYKGTQGLCPQRWELWKHRFGDIRDCEMIDTKTRDLAGKAVIAMEDAEQSGA